MATLIVKPTFSYVGNIFVNIYYEANISSGNCIMLDISDHFAQFCVCKVPGEKVIPSQVKICYLISLKVHLFIISSASTQTLSMEVMSINLSLSSITNLIG